MRPFTKALSVLLLSASTVCAQTTATDFTINDCSGVSHHLFGELDAGKIIVLDFVMPCIGCVVPSLETQTVVESYVATFPGRVEMYLIDDDALTPCGELTSWRNDIGLHMMPTFSDSAVIQDYYGTPGMPKIVVVGGNDHLIYDNQNNTVNTEQLKNAIDVALGISTNVQELPKVGFQFTIFPNPAGENATISCHQKASGTVSIKVIDPMGRVVKKTNADTRKGENNISIDLSGLPHGVYTVKVADAESKGARKLIVK